MSFYTYRVYSADMASQTVTVTTWARNIETARASFRDAVAVMYPTISAHVHYRSDETVERAINEDITNEYRHVLGWFRNATSREMIDYTIEYDNARGAVSYLRDVIGTLD